MLYDTYLELLNNIKLGINMKFMHVNRWFELLNTIKRALDDRRKKQKDLPGPTRTTNQR